MQANAPLLCLPELVDAGRMSLIGPDELQVIREEAHRRAHRWRKEWRRRHVGALAMAA